MKQTEVGLIPDDWEVKSFDELFDICTETVSLADISQRYYVGTENMLQDKKGIIENSNVLKYQNVRKYIKEDILISNIRPYLKKVWFADKNGGCSTDVLVFRNKRRQNDSFFLFMLISADRFFQIVNDNAVGTKMPRGDKNIIKQILFALPSSKQEQQRIAKALSDVDALITTTEKLIQKKKNIKQGTMQNLLTGKKRLPGFAKSAEYKQTELGLIPEDWEVIQIKDNYFLKGRIGWQGLKASEFLDRGPYLVTGTDFVNGKVNWETCYHISEKRYAEDKALHVKKDDLLITKDGTVGKVAYIDQKPEKVSLNSHLLIIRPLKDNLINKYLYYILNSKYFFDYYQQTQTGTTMASLSQDKISKFVYPLPSKVEQTAIANVLSSMDKEIETLNTKLEKYRNLKTAMMQQLLTGKIRLR